jgi:NDP-sugar pyrophosphorylase family protein
MNYIDYGLGILNADVFAGYPDGGILDLSKVYNELSLKNELFGYEVFERFYEIGSLQGILETEEYLTLKEKK